MNSGVGLGADTVTWISNHSVHHIWDSRKERILMRVHGNQGLQLKRGT